MTLPRPCPAAPRLTGAALAAALIAGPALGQAPAMAAKEPPPAGSYVFDPEHSQIAFSYSHMMFSTSRGLVNGVTGKITLDPADPSGSTVEASFPLSALRSVAPALDEHLKSDQFFGASGGHPVITFVSTGVLPDDSDEAKVVGDLTLNGVTRRVQLDVDYNGMGPNAITGKMTVGFDAETTIRRSDFNLGAFSPAVSDEVEIDISVEATLQD